MAVLRGMVLLIADKHSCDIIQMVMIDTKFLRRKSLKMIPFPCFRLTLVCLISFCFTGKQTYQNTSREFEKVLRMNENIRIWVRFNLHNYPMFYFQWFYFQSNRHNIS